MTHHVLIGGQCQFTTNTQLVIFRALATTLLLFTYNWQTWMNHSFGQAITFKLLLGAALTTLPPYMKRKLKQVALYDI